MTRRLTLSMCTVMALGIAASAQTPRTASVPYDHIHLAVPDPDKAGEWYMRNLDGQVGENPGRVMFEPFAGKRPLPVQLIFLRVEKPKPSDGGVIDSIGFSVADVAAKTKALEAAGAKVIAP